MRAHKRMKATLEGDHVTFDVLWVYDSKDPLVYQLWLPQIMGEMQSELKIKWNIGRELVRIALEPDRKIGGQMDILVMPEIDGMTTIYLRGDSYDRSEPLAILISMSTEQLREFNNDAHSLVSVNAEMELAMRRLLSEVG